MHCSGLECGVSAHRYRILLFSIMPVDAACSRASSSTQRIYSRIQAYASSTPPTNHAITIKLEGKERKPGAQSHSDGIL